MQVICHWAFAVAPALCPPQCSHILESGGGHVPLLDIWRRRLWTDRILIAILRLHYMHRGKNWYFNVSITSRELQTSLRLVSKL